MLCVALQKKTAPTGQSRTHRARSGAPIDVTSSNSRTQDVSNTTAGSGCISRYAATIVVGCSTIARRTSAAVTTYVIRFAPGVVERRESNLR